MGLRTADGVYKHNLIKIHPEVVSVPSSSTRSDGNSRVQRGSTGVFVILAKEENDCSLLDTKLSLNAKAYYPKKPFSPSKNPTV